MSWSGPRRLVAALGVASAAILAAGGAAADLGVTVTAVAGRALAGADRPLAQSSRVASAETVSTGGDGGCALLVDTDALVELCAGSRLSVDPRKTDGTRVVRVDAGEARIVLEPGAGERIEIHTPAAVATLLGTVVYVRVDGQTGETTITSGDHDVDVRSSQPGVAGSVRVGGGERVTLRPGEPPPARPERLPRHDVSMLGGCLVDFQSVAVAASRGSLQSRVADRVSEADIIGETEPVGSAQPTPPSAVTEPPGSSPLDPNEVLDEIGGEQAAMMMAPPNPGPPPGCDLPGICQPGPSSPSLLLVRP